VIWSLDRKALAGKSLCGGNGMEKLHLLIEQSGAIVTPVRNTMGPSIQFIMLSLIIKYHSLNYHAD